MRETISAAEKMLNSPPDVVLGKLSLWVAGPQGDYGWLDVGVRVGDQYDTVVEMNGPMIQKKDLIAFEPQLKALAESEKGEALLRSDGGSLTIKVTRYSRDFGNYIEVGLLRSIYNQKISFGFPRDGYANALVGLRAVLTRLEEELSSRRRPLPEGVPRPLWRWPARQYEGAFSAEDYPQDAIDREEEGISELEYVVAPSGEITDLKLVQSSGFGDLDEIALRVVAERFRYYPAADADGGPVPQTVRRKVVWSSRYGPPKVLDAAEVDFDFQVDGVGWFGVEVYIGARQDGFGGGWLTDYMGDLLRAGIAMASGVRYAEATFNSEPFLNRVEFEAVTLNESHAARNNQWTANPGCWVRLRELDQWTGEPREIEFEALCYSPLAVAEALYRMALPLFEENDRGDYPTFAALAAAIEAARSSGTA